MDVTRTRTRSDSESRVMKPINNNMHNTFKYSRRDPTLFMVRDTSVISNEFFSCLASGCMTSTRVAQFDSMTMRTGLSYCTKHVEMDEITNKVKGTKSTKDMTLIFYDIELSRDGEIEQIGACSESGETFSAIIRTSVRANTSPILSKITPGVWNMIAAEPKGTMERLIMWIKNVHSRSSNGNTDLSRVMLAAHYGSCHDHVYLLRTMMRWGVMPPPCRLVDTLVIFKVMKGMKENAKLHTLVTKYAPWVDHVAHDADSDADALRYVTMTAFPNTVMACYVFSISYADYASRTGLNQYIPSPIATFSFSNFVPSVNRRPSVATSDSSVATTNSF